MTGQPCECRFCGDMKSPQGIDTHETYCEENPNRGIPYEQQVEHGILEESGDTSDGPNPHQSASAESSDGLPPVQTLSGDKSNREPATDGGTDECPVCGSDDVMPADEAKDHYARAVEYPNPKAILAYSKADQSCQNPECAALWGEQYAKPLTMEEIVNA